ncbi:MAG TPA: SUMF1/EgtB/PvdO family nonheme iron enzyme [Vicinamibacterales bacterium]|nr:SUMF1/EgtB/PvdO family nonheme iron enzyme [Vicinamibacterales bacterium]
MRRRLLLAAIALAVGTAGFVSVRAAAQEIPEYGPPRGTLIIIGGGSTDGTGIIEKFIQIAGGPEKKFVIVPTAGGNRDAQGNVRVYEEERSLRTWKARGLKNVVMLHTHDPKVADTDEFVKPLLDADAVWFDGGRQWNIVDSYANTRTYKAFHDVLARGGVIAGSSAGATIQGAYLVRGDTSGPNVMMTEEPNHQSGFAFLKKSAIDQHINTRNRWDDLIPVIKKYPDLLGIGLSEGTAIIVTGDKFEVMGKWKVAVHDNTRLYQPWEKPYFVLSAGDVYNMKARRIEKLGIGATPGRAGGGGGGDIDESAPARVSQAGPVKARKDGKRIDQVWVPAGSFRMGTSPAQAEAAKTATVPAWALKELPSEQPDHAVRLTRGYWIDTYEVTNAAFQQFAESNGYLTRSQWSGAGWTWLVKKPEHRACADAAARAAPKLPCVNVTWFEAEAYAKWRGGRLPTEAEWEYAARGPQSLIYPWGNAFDTARANVIGSKELTAVGSLPAGVSPFGAHDMAGNAMEWVADWLDVNYYASSPAENPAGPAVGNIKIEKGGWWGSNSFVARSAYRHFEDPPDYADHHIGFRIVSDR